MNYLGQKTKDVHFTICINRSELDMLTRFCKDKDITKSGLVRSMIYSVIDDSVTDVTGCNKLGKVYPGPVHNWRHGDAQR